MTDLTDLEKLRIMAEEERTKVLTPIKPIKACCVVTRPGTVMWLDEQKQPHRSHVFGLPIDLPAIIELNGTKRYIWHGRYRRTKQRATIVHADGKREWVTGSWRDAAPKHEGPIYECGAQGPSIVYPDGRVIYTDREGEFMMEELWDPDRAAKYFK